jgi:hypothetical protein
MYTIHTNHQLKSAVTSLIQRESEVAQYQVNIDNYRAALTLIANKSGAEQAELDDFRQMINKLLASELLEQKKVQVMLEVALLQLAGQDITTLVKEAQNVPTE